MSTGDDNGNGQARSHKCTVLTLVYDHETCQVSLGVKDAPCGLLQMMLGEAMRQLEEQRRAAVAISLQRQLLEQSRNQALADSITGRR